MPRQKTQLNKAIGYLGFLLVIFCIGCGSKPPQAQPPHEPIHIKTVLMLPFQDMARIYGENVTVKDRLSGNIFTAGRVEPEADQVMTDQVKSLLKSRKNLSLIPESLAEGVMSNILSGEKSDVPEPELLARIGSSVGADALLVGKLYRFQQREGSGFSVTTPASVAFNLDLVRVSDSRVIWSGHFDETQKSLFEDLFEWNTFWKRKARWITAEQLASEGLNRVFETFPIK